MKILPCCKPLFSVSAASLLFMAGLPSLKADVTVNSVPLWTDTLMSVQTGDMVSITASGTWTVSGTIWCGPDGLTSAQAPATWDRFLYPGAQQGELIAYIGSNPLQGHWGDGTFFPQTIGTGYWAVGSSTQFSSDRSGELWLGINDDAVSEATGDNSGSLMAQISITQVPEPGSVLLLLLAGALGLVKMSARWTRR